MAHALAWDLLQRYREHEAELNVLMVIDREQREQLSAELKSALDFKLAMNRAAMGEISDVMARRRLHIVG